jgi:hypothetical protein
LKRIGRLANGNPFDVEPIGTACRNSGSTSVAATG